MVYVGAHVSTGGGWEKACEKAAGMGCNAVQIFSSSPRMWKLKRVEEIDVEGFVEARKKWGIEKSFIHATYLINLASDRDELVEKSREALVNDMRICAAAGMDGVVVHIGSHQGRGFEAVRGQLVREIGKILEESKEPTPSNSPFSKGGGKALLLENSAGQKGKVGSLEEIAWLLGELNSPAYAKPASRQGRACAGKVGWCVDTCHAHAAGYDLGSARLQASSSKRIQGSNVLIQNQLFEEAGKTKYLVEEVGRLGLWESLKCVHVNDSKDAFGSGRDRHENIGEGEVGVGNLKWLVNYEKIRRLPLILEVPGFGGKGPDGENVERVKTMVGE